MGLNIEAKDAYSLGIKAKRQESWRKAETHFQKAIKLEPSWAKPLEAVIRLRLDGHLSKSPLNYELAQFKKILPRSYKYWLFKGRYAHQLGKHQKALNAYTEALEIRPKTLSALLNRGDLHLHLGNAKLALQDYDDVLSLRSKHAEARWGKLLALVQMKRWTEAHQIANELALEDPENAALWNLRNLASRYSGLPPPSPQSRSKRDFRELPPSSDIDLTQE